MSLSAAWSAPAPLREDRCSGESGQTIEEASAASVRRIEEGGLKGSSAFLLTRRNKNLKYSRSNKRSSWRTAQTIDSYNA